MVEDAGSDHRGSSRRFAGRPAAIEIEEARHDLAVEREMKPGVELLRLADEAHVALSAERFRF